MFTMRPAVDTDSAGVAAMISARCDWMEQRGLESWRGNIDSLAGQAGSGFMWILEAAGHIVGCTTVTEHAPPKDWTPEECAEPSLYLFTTVTDPAYREHKPGMVIAWWAVDRAARQGRMWVRRGCFFPALVEYYQTQGFTLIKERERGVGRVYLLARRAEQLDTCRGLTVAGVSRETLP